MRTRHGFTLIESITLLATLSIGGALGASALKLNGSQEKAMQSNMQLRGIHQGLVTFAQSNKKGGHDGNFPGLDPGGDVIDGSTEGRFRIMFEGNFFTGDYIISPLENLTPIEVDDQGETPPLFAAQYSYAMLQIHEPMTDAGRRAEWKETLNTSAIVIGDRNTATPQAPSSVWSEGTEHGDWAGGITRNDNSTSFEKSPVFENTLFGSPSKNPAGGNPSDHLFVSETPAGHDALLTFTIDAFGDEVPTPRRDDPQPPAVPVMDGAA